MLRAILLGHLLAVGDVLLHGRVDDDLFADGVTGELPDELVLVPDLLVLVGRVHDLVVEALELGVLSADGVEDAVADWGCRVGSAGGGWGVYGGYFGPDEAGGGPEGEAEGLKAHWGCFGVLMWVVWRRREV
jgi:hypothetical protein